MSDLDSFDKNWEPLPWIGCFVWTGPLKNERGIFKVNGRYDYAYRVSYRRHYGSIPDGAFICHKCDNPLCVNPDHLFAGTQLDNMQDCKQKGRNAFGEKLPHTRLSLNQVSEILSDTRPQKEIATHHGISQSYVSSLKSGAARRTGSSDQPAPYRKHSEKLSAVDVLAIRSDPRTQVAIAAQYGIDASTVSLIKNKKIWRDV